VRSPHSGKLQPSKRELLWLREGKVCHWCRRPTRYIKEKGRKNAWDMVTIDHVLPRYKGGTNEESNCVSACRRCNNRRCYEDTFGLPDGSLLDSYPPSAEQRELHRKIRRAKTTTLLFGGNMETKLKVEGHTRYGSQESMLTLEQLLQLANDLLPDRTLTVHGMKNTLYIHCTGDCDIRGNTESKAEIEVTDRGWSLRLEENTLCFETGTGARTLEELRQQLSEFAQTDNLIGTDAVALSLL
jgi:hypothetical protein